MGQVSIEQNYGLGKGNWDSTCGTPTSYLTEFLSTEPWGVTTFSPLLNTIIHGWCPNTFYEVIASSGAGKSMMSYSAMAYGYLNKFYEDGTWKDTMNTHSCLYIGTEMDIKSQVIPQIACCESESNYNLVKLLSFSEAQMRHYKEAIEYLYASNSIFLENEPDYNLAKLGNLVSGHIKKDHIQALFLDYMEVTSSMSDKYTDDVKVLNSLATYCKDNLATKDIAVIAFAQANKRLENINLCDIDSSSIKGSHTIHQKADVLMYLIPGGNDDQKTIHRANGYFPYETTDQYIDKGIYSDINAKTLNPERIRKILIGDKCRPDTSKRGLCVWCFIEDGTLRWHDLFVTDSEYRIRDMESTYLCDGTEPNTISRKSFLPF